MPFVRGGIDLLSPSSCANNFCSSALMPYVSWACHRRCVALLGVDDLEHIGRGDLADQPIGPRFDEYGSEGRLSLLTASLMRHLLSDECLRNVRKRMLDAQRRLFRFGLTLHALDCGRIDALIDLRAPLAGNVAGFLK